MPNWLRPALALFAIGWGANQFAALLLVYEALGASTSAVTLLFGAYALGLIPALLLVAPISDRLGRRAVIRPVLVLSAIATVVLLSAGTNSALLLVGRLLAGIASGAAFAPGTAWVKELSIGPAGTGARRAAIALSAGFGSGPLVAGAVAQWLPEPTSLPYLPHLVLIAAAAAIAWHAPEPERPAPTTVQGETRRVMSVLSSAPFLLRLAPTAPWVFGTASLAFTAVAAAAPIPGPRIAVASMLAALVLWTGVAVQPLGRRFEPAGTIVLGAASGVIGFGIAALASVADSPLLAVLAVVALGGAYGWILVGGLTTVEQIADPADLATVNAVFYSLTYLGFAAPYVGTLLLQAVSPTTAMLILGALLAATIPLVASTRRVLS